MSQEKVDVLKALGAEIIRTPTEAAWDSPESHIGVAKKLNAEIPNSHILDQYKNPSNPLAHYDTTAEEILNQCDGKLDMVVLTAGTGGTLTGVARKIKERLPHCIVVGVDPEGSILAYPDSLNGAIHSYKVEGIGYDFIPAVFDRDPAICDKWIKTRDPESFTMSRRLIRSEGLLCGGSAGSAMWAAIQAIKEYKLGKGKRVVVLLADSVRNYMSKFLSDKWMIENGFLSADDANKSKSIGNIDWKTATVKDMAVHGNVPNAVSVSEKKSIKEVHELLQRLGFDQVPVHDEHNVFVGYVTVQNILAKIKSKRANPTDTIHKVMYKFNTKRPYIEFTDQSKLADIDKFFEKNPAAFITERNPEGKPVVKKVITKVDLLHFIMKTQQ
jgi:cystathionine beta-synthase